MTPTVRPIQPEQIPLALGIAPEPAEIYRRVFRRLRLACPVPNLHVDFHPFAGLRSTIHLRGHHMKIRISDVLRDAPLLVHEALAEYLLCKVYRRRASREARECYLAYVFKPAIRQRIDEARHERGTKRFLPARGRWHDLKEIFHRLNRKYFGGDLSAAGLGWSLRKSRTVLGHYDAGHGMIVINRALDSPAASACLVEYLVFHEMLHMRFPVERNGHRRVVHSREFREAERRFPGYEEARRSLKHFQC